MAEGDAERAMRAIVCTAYGPPEVLQFREVDDPIPRRHEVLIRVRATSVHRGDSRMRGLDIPGPGYLRLLARLALGVRRPRKAILGMELAGEVVSVGAGVTRFREGDRVFASTAWSGFGAYAEWKSMAEDGAIATMPAQVSFEEAAVIPSGGITTLGILERARIQPGQRVLVHGASGSVGTFAVQIARALGADVTGVCSAANFELVRSLGAARVLDRAREDFAAGGETYDVVVDAVGTLEGDARRALAKARFYLDVHRASDAVRAADAPRLLHELKALIEDGKLRAVIDRRYSWEQIVEAHRYVDQGHKKGNVVVTVGA
jgi:NADPH:quinone reductase-like Zn-dependent oxidoreductase